MGMLFGFLWLLLFVIYYPAAKAGFVTDFTGWLDQVKNHSFREYINRTNFRAGSWYQFTQFNTWFFYKLFGIHAWLWHLLFITLHTVNACLLFILSCHLMEDVGISRKRGIAFGGALLFCVSPYISEVVVWEPAFHFLQGLLLLLVILVWAQLFQRTGKKKYAWWAAIVYILSTFSLEIFYITPWLVLSLALFHRFHLLLFGKRLFNLLFRYFFIPQIIIFFVRIIAYRLYAGDWVSRIGSGTVSLVTMESFGKPAKYLFHLLFLGRFFPEAARHKVYAVCDSFWGIALFYSIVLLVFVYIAIRFTSIGRRAKIASLFFVWMMTALLLLVPLWFSDDLLVVYDRYIYFAGAFFYMLFAVLVSMITLKYVRVWVLGLSALINLRFAIQVSRYWSKSVHIVDNLLRTIPDERDKTIILLNIPQNMHGIPMIGAEKNSEYKLMHDLLLPDKLLTNTVYDGLAYNMLTPMDGAHVNVVNDSMVKVTLNQWGTWWWFETRGGYSYWTTDYKLDLKDPGHWYELTLRKPAGQYLLLYNTGDQWKVVDMSKKDVDQN